MGLFSWKCSLSGIEIAGPNSPVQTPRWMHEVVVFTPEGKPLKGRYDGYGKIYCVTPGQSDHIYDFWDACMQSHEGKAHKEAMERWNAAVDAKVKELGFKDRFEMIQAGYEMPRQEYVPLPRPKVVISRFYKGQKPENIPQAAEAEWQGWYIPLCYLESIEALARNYEDTGVKVPAGNWDDDDDDDEEELIDAM